MKSYGHITCKKDDSSRIFVGNNRLDIELGDFAVVASTGHSGIVDALYDKFKFHVASPCFNSHGSPVNEIRKGETILLFKPNNS